MDDAEIDSIQMMSKSDKTHSNTRWGVKIFRGKLSLIHVYIQGFNTTEITLLHTVAGQKFGKLILQKNFSN